MKNYSIFAELTIKGNYRCIAILAISADITMAQTQEKTVYIIDGQVATKAALDSLPSEQTYRDVLKGCSGLIEQIR